MTLRGGRKGCVSCLVELTELGPSWLDHLKTHRAAGGDLVAHWSGRP